MHDRRVGAGPDLPGRLDAVDPGQVDVHQHQVGPQLPDGDERLLAGRHRAHDLEAVGHLDHGRHRTPERLLVVDDQDAHDTHEHLHRVIILDHGPRQQGGWSPGRRAADPTLAGADTAVAGHRVCGLPPRRSARGVPTVGR